MDHQADPQWLTWTKRLQAIAQTGLTFTRDHYDQERYEELREIAAEMMAAGSGMPDSAKILDLFTAESGYATPKIEVRGAVVVENQILLVREREDGRWTIPGGWADVGDSPSDMVAREVKEETGYDVKPLKLTKEEKANVVEFLKALTGDPVKVVLPTLPPGPDGKSPNPAAALEPPMKGKSKAVALPTDPHGFMAGG